MIFQHLLKQGRTLKTLYNPVTKGQILWFHLFEVHRRGRLTETQSGWWVGKRGTGCCTVAQSCGTLCGPMDCSTPGFPVLHYFLEFAQTHVHWVGDAIQPSHPLSSPSPPALILSQHEGLFQWVSSSHQVAKVLELQLQHQSFQWILISFRIDWFDLPPKGLPRVFFCTTVRLTPMQNKKFKKI